MTRWWLLTRSVLLVLLAFFGARLSAAEETLLGARVRLRTAGSGALVGVVTASDEESFLVRRSGEDTLIRVPRSELTSVEVSRGYRRNTVKGLVGGALAWAAVVGLYATFDTLDESGVGEPLFIGGMVALGGAVGSLVKTEKWQRVSPGELSLRLAPRRRGFAAELALAW